MKLYKLLGLAIVMCSGVVKADPSESGVPTSPLGIYSGGLAVGAVKAINDELKSESKNFFKLCFTNDIYLTDVKHIFIDVDWFAPGANFGTDVGVDYLLGSSQTRPFIGAGVGVRTFDKNGYESGDNFGLSATLHAGVAIELSRTVQLRIRVPFHAVLNDTRDCGAGLDIGLLFSRPYQHVKQLHYDQN
jgi:hypothetical protein